MRLVQVISESKDGNRREVIGRDADGPRTLHIQKKNKVWRYCVGRGMVGKQFFLPLRFMEKEED